MTPSSAKDRELPEISPSELDAQIQRGDAPTLVDVREPHEREIADLPDLGQLRIPLPEFLQRMSELDPDEPVVLYCRSGSRSGWATRQLLAKGYRKVWNLRGGLLGWKQEVDPSIQEY
ncbi:MAG: rhodanese-like domain-containing protein [Gemmatimonadota bacterium]